MSCALAAACDVLRRPVHGDPDPRVRRLADALQWVAARASLATARPVRTTSICPRAASNCATIPEIPLRVALGAAGTVRCPDPVAPTSSPEA